MTNNELLEGVIELLNSSPQHQALLVKLEELIASEEAAWNLLEELQASDVAEHQEHLQASLAAALAAYSPNPVGES